MSSFLSKKYNRKEYGRWRDVDRDCQNTRHEVLISSSTKTVQFKTRKEFVISRRKSISFTIDRY